MEKHIEHCQKDPSHNGSKEQRMKTLKTLKRHTDTGTNKVFKKHFTRSFIRHSSVSLKCSSPLIRAGRLVNWKAMSCIGANFNTRESNNRACLAFG